MVTRHAGRDGDRTTFQDVAAAVRARSAPVLDAWPQAMRCLEALRAARPGRPCLAGIVSRPGQAVDRWGMFVRFLEEGAAGPLSVTLGRHPMCAQWVASASLRHVTVLAWPDAEKAEIVARDLCTGSHLGVGRAVATRVEGNNALRFTVGEATAMLAVVPAGVALTTVAEPRDTEMNALMAPSSMAEGALLDGADCARPREGSFAVYLERLGQGGPGSQAMGWAGPHVPAVVAPDGTIRGPDGRIVHPGRWATFELDDENARRGVIFGRYGRCERNALLSADGAVSRVHVLVVRQRGALWAVDTASTNGTEVLRDGESRARIDALHPVTAVEPGDTLRVGHLWVDLRGA